MSPHAGAPLASAEAPVASARDDPAARLVLIARTYHGLRVALGRFAPLGRLVGDPRLGMAGVFLSFRRVLPNRYPITRLARLLERATSR